MVLEKHKCVKCNKDSVAIGFAGHLCRKHMDQEMDDIAKIADGKK